MNKVELNEAHVKLHAFNRTLSIILRVGIALSLLMTAAGLVLYAVKGSLATELTPLWSLAAGLAGLEPTAFITLGLMIMLALPAVILLASFAHFTSARQKRPALVCAILIILLAAGIALALLFHL